MTETHVINNKASGKRNWKVLELVNDEGLIAPYLASFSVVVFKPENKSQLNILKDPKSIRVNGFLINTSISVSLFSNMLVFRDTNNSFKLDGDLLKTMTNYDISVSHLNPQDQKQIHEFGKEMNFNIKQKGRNTNRDESLIKLLELPAYHGFWDFNKIFIIWS